MVAWKKMIEFPKLKKKRELLRDFYRATFAVATHAYTSMHIRVVYINKFVAQHENLFYRKYSLEKKNNV